MGDTTTAQHAEHRAADRQLPGAGPLNVAILNTGLLNITTAGDVHVRRRVTTMRLVALTSTAISLGTQGTGGARLSSVGAPLSTYLSAGQHVISYGFSQLTGGGGYQLFYSGPDTAGKGTTGLINDLVALPSTALSYTTNARRRRGATRPSSSNGFTVAAGNTATFDGQGTTFNTGVGTLSLGAGSTLNAVNLYLNTTASHQHDVRRHRATSA